MLEIGQGLYSVVKEVAESYWKRRLIVFAGTGVSEAAGLPSQAALIRRMSAYAEKLDIDHERVEEVNSLLRKGLLADALTELREGMGMVEFGHCFERYQSTKYTKVPDIARAIAELAPNLHAVITPSMDSVLERVFGADWATFANVTRDIPQRHRYILMLRGMLSDRSTWIVTRNDYEKAWQDSKRVDVLTSLYHAHQIVFICHDFSDGNIERIVERVGVSRSPQPPRHIALIPAGGSIYQRKTLLTAAGIRVIELGTPDNSYAAIASFLRSIADPNLVTEHPDTDIAAFYVDSRAGVPAQSLDYDDTSDGHLLSLNHCNPVAVHTVAIHNAQRPLDDQERAVSSSTMLNWYHERLGRKLLLALSVVIVIVISWLAIYAFSLHELIARYSAKDTDYTSFTEQSITSKRQEEPKFQPTKWLSISGSKHHSSESKTQSINGVCRN